MNRKQNRKQRLEKKQQKERQRELFRQLSPLLWTFVVWFALLSLIHTPLIKDPLLDFFVGFTTHSAYWFGRLLLLPVEMDRVPFLSVNGFHMRVVMECTAYNFYLFAGVLMIFVRWPLKHRLISLGIFFLLIFVMNNLRFITMGYLGSYRPELFDVVHDYLWNILFGFMVFGTWAWREHLAGRLEKAGNKGGADTALPADA